ncbi:MAG: radical SAM protein, partial [Nitrospinae bacterium]|nr:radical SAM protein [Nitrospinota bacterium]
MRQLLKLAQKSFISNFKPLNFPMKLNFLLTFKCNARCIMCNIWKKRDTPELTISEIERFFSKSNKFSWLDLSGGEIFLRKDIVEVVEIILRNCKDLYLLHFAT